MSDVGGLGRPVVERVDRSHAPKDQARQRRKGKKKDDSKSAPPEAPDPESTEETGAVIDVLDAAAEGRQSPVPNESQDDDLDEEEPGCHVDTRA